MNYEQEIKEILFEAGNDGLPIKIIARHIFNMHNGLFETTPLEQIYKSLQTVVAKNNKSKTPFMEKAEKWGYYRLTQKSKNDTQLLLQFRDDNEDCNDESPDSFPQDTDLSLSLF